MANNFTPAQLEAINTLDKSVLVAAAAGSGKTTILVERIIGIILNGRANVDEMLVVTFTKAAAAEMRLRLGAAIRKRMKEHPEDAPRMREQLSRMYKAYISTIDSFTLRVVREFFHEIDIEPEFGICDDVQAELMKREAATELIEEGFENDGLIEGGSFREFMRLYGDERSDDRFAENLIGTYDSLRTMPNYFDWTYEKAELLKIDKDSFEESKLQEIMLEDALELMKRTMEGERAQISIIESAGLKGFAERKFSEELAQINSICEELRAGRLGEGTFAAMNSIDWAQMRCNKDEKESWEPIKEEVGDIRKAVKNGIKDFNERYLVPSFEACLAEMNATYDYTIYYIKILEEFERRYAYKKSRKKLMDLADVSHAAVRILEHEDAAEALKKRFKFVFVDEYQDTNRLQEYLIDKVSGPANSFKVGDVKQSIYKFRLAEPEIFEGLQKGYSDESNEEGKLINLSANFRTNDATIKYINHVFEHVMEGYDDDVALHTGITDIPAEYDFKPEVHVLLKDGAPDEVEYEDLTDDVIEEDGEDLSNDEAEAEYIAKLAAGIIGTEFYDAKKGVVRKAEARDIAILMRSVKFSGERIASALAARSVEAHIEETDDYFNTLEIDIALALFSCIDNMKRDVPLIATLHSEVFGFETDELAEIRISYGDATDERYSPYWKAFEWFISEGPESALRDKAIAASDKIKEWRRLSRMMPLSDFIWKVLTDSGYYAAVGAMSAGGRRQANLRALADKALGFSDSNVASLSSFISFVEVMKSKKISNGQPPMAGKDDDLVRISTMHKSKGLEFPFVIVGGLGRRFQRDGAEKKFSFDSGIGIGLPYIDPDRKYWRSSLMQLAMKSKYDRDCYKEDIRLLYVDMTRARNKLYLVGSVSSEESLMKFGNPNSYLKLLKDFIKTPLNTYHVEPLNRSAGIEDEEAAVLSWEAGPLSAEAEAQYRELDRRFSFEYPEADKLSEKSKYSVSEIRRNELEAEAERETADTEEEAASDAAALPEAEIVGLWDNTERKKRAGAADIGIAYHRIMEFLDFDKVMLPSGDVDSEYISERARYLKDNNAVSEEVFGELKISKIAEFFRTDIGERTLAAAKAGRLRREKPFTLRTERGGREILVQGVIDCCFEEDGEMVIIDYKSNFIRRGREHDAEIERIKKEYKTQIELYSEATYKGTGLKTKEAYLYLFATSEAVKMQ